MNVFFIWLIGAVLGGSIGAVLGNTIGKDVAGWWLGFLLGPIGWIIVFLLPRDDNKESNAVRVNNPKGNESSLDGPPGEQDLSEDAYKIWLVRKYKIERNDALEKFICEDRLFPTVDGALAYAHAIEQEHGKTQKQEADEGKMKTEEQTARDPVSATDNLMLIAGIIALMVFVFVLAEHFA